MRRMSALITLFNIILETLASTIREEKENKRHTNWKEELKLFLLPDDIIVYIDISKGIYRK